MVTRVNDLPRIMLSVTAQVGGAVVTVPPPNPRVQCKLRTLHIGGAPQRNRAHGRDELFLAQLADIIRVGLGLV